MHHVGTSDEKSECRNQAGSCGWATLRGSCMQAVCQQQFTRLSYDTAEQKELYMDLMPRTRAVQSIIITSSFRECPVPSSKLCQIVHQSSIQGRIQTHARVWLCTCVYARTCVCMRMRVMCACVCGVRLEICWLGWVVTVYQGTLRRDTGRWANRSASGLLQTS